jgi:hypothetical protein
MNQRVFPGLPFGTRIAIGWLFLSWQEFPESFLWMMLFLTVVFLPLYIDKIIMLLLG